MTAVEEIVPEGLELSYSHGFELLEDIENQTTIVQQIEVNNEYCTVSEIKPADVEAESKLV